MPLCSFLLCACHAPGSVAAPGDTEMNCVMVSKSCPQGAHSLEIKIDRQIKQQSVKCARTEDIQQEIAQVKADSTMKVGDRSYRIRSETLPDERFHLH